MRSGPAVKLMRGISATMRMSSCLYPRLMHEPCQSAVCSEVVYLTYCSDWVYRIEAGERKCGQIVTVWLICGVGCLISGYGRKEWSCYFRLLQTHKNRDGVASSLTEAINVAVYHRVDMTSSGMSPTTRRQLILLGLLSFDESQCHLVASRIGESNLLCRLFLDDDGKRRMLGANGEQVAILR